MGTFALDLFHHHDGVLMAVMIPHTVMELCGAQAGPHVRLHRILSYVTKYSLTSTAVKETRGSMPWYLRNRGSCAVRNVAVRCGGFGVRLAFKL